MDTKKVKILSITFYCNPIVIKKDKMKSNNVKKAFQPSLLSL